MNFFDHKDLGNQLLQYCPRVVKHPVCDFKMNPLSPSTFPSLRVVTVLMQHLYICLTVINALGTLEHQNSLNCTEIGFLVGVNLAQILCMLHGL